MLYDELIDQILNANKSCFSRSCFDALFKFLLSVGFSKCEARDKLLVFCEFSALVLQERIYNDYYQKIDANTKIADDLAYDYGHNYQGYFIKVPNFTLPASTVKTLPLEMKISELNTYFSVIYDNLALEFPKVVFEESPAELDHSGDIDYLGWVGQKAFGLQIKPVTAQYSFANYKPSERMQANFANFEQEYGGKVFVVFSDQKEIKYKEEIIAQIKAEIQRLSS